MPLKGERKGFTRSGEVKCRGCFLKNLENQDLKERLKRAEDKLKLQQNHKPLEQSNDQSPHMPSSTKRFKNNSTQENRDKKGGAKFGHKGYGRKKAELTESVEMTVCDHPTECPCCNIPLSTKDTKTRTIVEVTKIKAERKILSLKRGQCPKCRKLFNAQVPVFPKALYGNRLISQAAVMHYVHGVSIGRTLEILGSEVTEGGLIEAFHRIGKICEKARPQLILEYRASSVKQADETGWRTDGQSGYAWVFVSKLITLIEFRESRAARIAGEILGDQPLNGVLVVDRYGGYNRFQVKIQYCYAHLLREVEKLEKEMPDNKEVILFVSRMSLYLTQAMKLRGLGLVREEFLKNAQQIKENIIHEITSIYKDFGIIRIQQIFQEKKHRLYHWADDPEVPADNNRAEREIRPTVISRKISFGSQSQKGAKTRSSIMSVLYTAKKRLNDLSIEDWFYDSLNKLVVNPNLAIFDLIPQAP